MSKVSYFGLDRFRDSPQVIPCVQVVSLLAIVPGFFSWLITIYVFLQFNDKPTSIIKVIFTLVSIFVR
jgi:hypothetical protein